VTLLRIGRWDQAASAPGRVSRSNASKPEYSWKNLVILTFTQGDWYGPNAIQAIANTVWNNRTAVQRTNREGRYTGSGGTRRYEVLAGALLKCAKLDGDEEN
jgi:hypothetical protein